MKRSLTYLAVAFCLAASQQAPAMIETLRLQAGANVGSTSGGGAGSTRLMVGAATEFYVGKGIFLQPELNYMGQASGLDYLTVPLMFTYKFETDSPINPFFMAGPEVGIKVNGVGIEPANLSLDFGAGAEYTLSETYRLVGLVRYSLGVTDISEAVMDTKTRNLHVLAGMRIVL